MVGLSGHLAGGRTTNALENEYLGLRIFEQIRMANNEFKHTWIMNSYQQLIRLINENVKEA